MVWFQCEDCGDNLKKPKLPNHFRPLMLCLKAVDCRVSIVGICLGSMMLKPTLNALLKRINYSNIRKLSNLLFVTCYHEKYGPKGQGKASNGVNTKPQNDAKKKPDVDINVGLSERSPWFCSLCNTKATSKQTLLLHADGKKHRAKARGFHAKQQSSSTVDTNGSAENHDFVDSRDLNPSQVTTSCDGSEVENDHLESNKKRKLEASENAIPIKGAETEVTNGLKKAKLSAKEEHAKPDLTADKDVCNKKIKWKKHITSALKSKPDGALKLKELKKLVKKSLKDSGFVEDKNQVSEMIEKKGA